MSRPPRFRWPSVPLYAAAAICEDVCRPLGIEPPLYRRRLDFFLKNRAFKIDKAKKELGWEPVVDLDKGIEQTLQWYRKGRVGLICPGWLSHAPDLTTSDLTA